MAAAVRSIRRVVFVAGGTRGIGRAIAELFAERGASVVAAARSAPARGLPASIRQVRLDVRDRQAVLAAARQVRREFGALNVVVNCAGVSRWRAVERLDEPFVDEVVQTSLLGTLWGCAAAARLMRRGGCIVNVSSLAGKRGSANNSAYCAGKFAVNGITQALAKELGPRGIRVNAVCPVYVKTEEIVRALSDPASPAGRTPAARYLRAFAGTQTALGRLPTARDVAETVYFLAGPEAGAITGQCLNVDCGVLPQ